MKRIAQFILFFIISFASLAQTQIGSDIRGIFFGDLCGHGVTISNDGRIVAAGSPGADSGGPNKGHVRVFEDINGTWTQIGSDIDGEFSNDASGKSISISGDGTTVAIASTQNTYATGHVRVYKNINNTWTQLGSDIDGEASGDKSGTSVSLSRDGSTVAIGAPQNDGNGDDAGHVRVYRNVNNSWTQIGSDIDGEASGDYSGFSVSLSDSGTILAVGAIRNAGGVSNRIANRGHVRVFKNINGTWTQIGSDIDGEWTSDYFGFSVSLSSNGEIVAAGAIYNDGAATNAGQVRVFENINGSWAQLGADIDGKNTGDRFGYSVSLSSNGKTVLIGAASAESWKGQARVYKFSNSNWTQYGDSLNGVNAGDSYGQTVGISGDGSRIAIGGSSFDLPASSAGHVQVFEICVNDYSIDTVSSCDSFTWVDGITYYESDTNSTYSFTNAMGCDSIVKLNLTISNSKFSTDTVVACETYLWTNGIRYNESNSNATDTFYTTSGCDSIVTINLTINKKSKNEITLSDCDSHTTSSGKTFYRSGTYLDTIINYFGCDSLITYNLDIIEVDKIISEQPSDVTKNVGETASFTVKANKYPSTFYQWQSNQGFGFQNLSNASQFSGVNNDTLFISDARLTNNNQKFRCVLSVNDCNATTASVNLYVNENASIKDRYDNKLISIYPNPTSDFLNIKVSPKIIGSSYTLIDIRGTIIMSGILKDNITKISLREISKGVYYLYTKELSKVIKVVR